MSGLMPTIVDELNRDKSIKSWIFENSPYITMMGSRAYGTFHKDSDFDLYGFTIPPKKVVFPFSSGYIYGFDTKMDSFEQLKKHGMVYNGVDVDLQMYSIVKYFKLLAQGNPNMLDSLFTKREYVIKCTKIGEMLRLNKKMFLHKGAYHRFKGYAFAQLHKAKSKNRNGKRKEIVEKYGFDVKFGGHILRLLDECEQIFTTGDIDLERNREQVKAVHRGDISLEDIEFIFADKEKYLAKLYEDSSLPYGPDLDAIRKLLFDCLEEHFGTIDKSISTELKVDNKRDLIKEVSELVERRLI